MPATAYDGATEEFTPCTTDDGPGTAEISTAELEAMLAEPSDPITASEAILLQPIQAAAPAPAKQTSTKRLDSWALTALLAEVYIAMFVGKYALDNTWPSVSRSSLAACSLFVGCEL